MELLTWKFKLYATNSSFPPMSGYKPETRKAVLHRVSSHTDRVTTPTRAGLRRCRLHIGHVMSSDTGA